MNTTRLLLAILAAAVLSGCTDPGAERRREFNQKIDNTVYALVVCYQDEDLLPHFNDVREDNGDFYRGVRRLLWDGLIEVTEHGFRPKHQPFRRTWPMVRLLNPGTFGPEEGK